MLRINVSAPKNDCNADVTPLKLVADKRFGTPGDLAYCYEALYRTQKGSYFLYGEGGPQTIYARRVDTNTYSGGSRIMPLTADEALEWCEENRIDAEIVERYFAGKVTEA